MKRTHSTVSGRETSKWTHIGWIAAIVSIAFAVLFSAAHFGFRYWLEKETRARLSADEFAEMERIFTERLDIPREWLEERAYPPELVSQAVELNRQFDRHHPNLMFEHVEIDVFITGMEFNRSYLPDIEKKMEASRAFADNLIAYFTHPDYSLGCVHNSSGSFKNHNWLTVGCIRLRVLAYILAQQGRYREAFEVNYAMHRMAKRYPGFLTIKHITGEGYTLHASRSTEEIAQLCDDAEVMADALRNLNGLAKDVIIQCLDRMRLWSTVEMLVYARKQGFIVELAGRKTLGYYLRRENDYWIERSKIKGVLTPPGDYRHWENVIRLGNTLGLSNATDRYVYACSINRNWRKMPVMEKAVTAEFHLARLTLASRIQKLKTRKFPRSAGELVPELLPEEPADPFSGNSFRCDRIGEFFYSVGPDGQDDSCRAIVDPYSERDKTGQGDMPPYYIRLKRKA